MAQGHLRGHEPPGTGSAGHFVHTVRGFLQRVELLGQAEIEQLDAALEVKAHVVGFQVAKDDLQPVQVPNRPANVRGHVQPLQKHGLQQLDVARGRVPQLAPLELLPDVDPLVERVVQPVHHQKVSPHLSRGKAGGTGGRHPVQSNDGRVGVVANRRQILGLQQQIGGPVAKLVGIGHGRFVQKLDGKELAVDVLFHVQALLLLVLADGGGLVQLDRFEFVNGIEATLSELVPEVGHDFVPFEIRNAVFLQVLDQRGSLGHFLTDSGGIAGGLLTDVQIQGNHGCCVLLILIG
mmetsp:Transcript_15554/g.35855  ORF Transcript_15554/g.35855 Transcript_15554/m.35855 type:complete len:293 (+) Transcript_15554:467-1345(+)